MKKYFFEAFRKELEKPTEPKYMFNTTAKVIVFAENDEEALVLAKKKLQEDYYGTGIQLGEPSMTGSYDLPIDWSYGYGDDRKSGCTAELGDLVGNNVIR